LSWAWLVWLCRCAVSVVTRDGCLDTMTVMAKYRAILFDLDGTLVDTIPDIAHAVNMALGELGRPGHSVDACREMVGWGVHELARRALLAVPSPVSEEYDGTGEAAPDEGGGKRRHAQSTKEQRPERPDCEQGPGRLHRQRREQGPAQPGRQDREQGPAQPGGQDREQGCAGGDEASSVALWAERTPSEAAVEDLAERIARWFRARPYQYSRPYEGVREVLEALEERGVGLGVVTNKPHEIAEPVCHAAFPSVQFASIHGAGNGLPPKPDPSAIYRTCERLEITPAEAVLVGDSVVDVRTARNAGCGAVAVRWGYGAPRVLEEERPDALVDRPDELLELCVEL